MDMEHDGIVERNINAHFSDGNSSAKSPPSTESQGIDGQEEQQKTWRGCSLEALHIEQNPFKAEHLAPVHPSNAHTVLYEYPISVEANVPPPTRIRDVKWDSNHVRLPCSPESKYPIEDENGQRIVSRWQLIERALLQPINNSYDLQSAILSYNNKYKSIWCFVALHNLFQKELDESESRVFFEDLLPRIIRLALRLPELVGTSLPLLKQQKNHSVSMTQQQAACLMANAFLCTYPRRNSDKRKSEYYTFPDINFNRIFAIESNSVSEKLKCIFHYFRRVCPTERDNSNVPNGCLTFMRRSYPPAELPKWTDRNELLGKTLIHINSSGTIEDDGQGLLQVDFANRFLGGGVLGHGCVQEEIRFVICPELIVGKLICESMRSTEALIIQGAERFSDYSGYAGSFAWAGNHVDQTPRDSSRRLKTTIVAIDALRFQQEATQYTEKLMLRELNKAYVGLVHSLQSTPPGVATGNWGCGAFGGDAYLKALLQLMVCTVHRRGLAYYTFGNDQLRDDLLYIHGVFSRSNTSVMDLWGILRRFDNRKISLYQFVKQEVLREAYPCLELNAAKEKITNKTLVAAATADPGEAAAIAAVLSSDTSEDDFELLSSENEPTALSSDDGDHKAGSIDNLVAAARNGNASSGASSTAPSTSTNTESASSANSASPSIAENKKTRQLTLIEMLEGHYQQGTSNGSKRQRQAKPGAGNTNAAP